ncbi:MAG: HEPN domain-containing protein [Verrucomicrobiae bacterium]|nr:HEPN domain-containing protein [Verrucomicrobiae bacterium]
MPRPPTELARVWLMKAYGDLHTAVQIGGLPDGHLDAGIYHCQQAAEKALKGYLVFRESPFEKVHDLGKIIERAMTLEPGFKDYEDAAESLTPLASASVIPMSRVSLSQPEKNLTKPSPSRRASTTLF